MEQVVKKISTYSADWAGVCSALYELGGMLVIHDASGCNSTYTTFDEPRWYNMDSLFFISGLSEMDAVLGNDEKLVQDIVRASIELSPKFIAIIGSPIPNMMGTDFDGLARSVEHLTNIPTFGFASNGMNDYCAGGAAAFESIAKRFCIKKDRIVKPTSKDDKKIRINLLGVTPLDFSINGNIEALCKVFEEGDYKINSVWAMNSTLDEIINSSHADVNVVVSTLGIKAARYLEHKFNIPYVVGLPCGIEAMKRIDALIRFAHKEKANQCLSIRENSAFRREKVLVIAELVKACGMRYCMKEEFGFKEADILCPLNVESWMKQEKELLLAADSYLFDEEKIKEKMAEYDIILADPMYGPLLSNQKKTRLIPIPHEAFSSRIYRKEAPIIIGRDFSSYIEESLKTLKSLQ